MRKPELERVGSAGLPCGAEELEQQIAAALAQGFRLRSALLAASGGTIRCRDFARGRFAGYTHRRWAQQSRSDRGSDDCGHADRGGAGLHGRSEGGPVRRRGCAATHNMQRLSSAVESAIWSGGRGVTSGTTRLRCPTMASDKLVGSACRTGKALERKSDRWGPRTALRLRPGRPTGGSESPQAEELDVVASPCRPGRGRPSPRRPRCRTCSRDPKSRRRQRPPGVPGGGPG